MGYEHYLRRDDNRTLFQLGKGVGEWIEWLGDGAPFVVTSDDEEALAVVLEADMTEHKWNLDTYPGGVAGYARFVAHEIVRWCDGQPFRAVGEESYEDWEDDPSWSYERAVTGSRYTQEKLQ